MTRTLPPDTQQVFERFITTEYTTIDSSGQPITWPVTPYYRAGDGAIDVTTGLGYPKKADDAAREPRVSLLFSDPTGSGIDEPCTVLVQGTAEVDDRDLAANRERYARESVEKLPATKSMHPPKLIRSTFDWYFMRIYVYVRPERVFIWEKGDFTREPQLFDSHVEEVRSHHSEEPPIDRPPPAGGSLVWDDRLEELGRRHPTAVLTLVGPDGFPISLRLPIEPDRDANRIRLGELPEWLAAAEGRACLCAHAHHPDFIWQTNFQVRGDLVREDGGWSLVPHRLVGGFELPESKLTAYRQNLAKMLRFRKTAKRELARRRAATPR
jgi:pyridoxamine 5'-phosphate oxidase-like protein